MPPTKQVAGADVSHWQTPSARLIALLVSLSIRFCWVKVSDGARLRDVAYGSHHARLSAAGIARGPYHFYRFSVSPEANAENFLGAIAGKTWELPPAIDVEQGDSGTNDQNAAAILRFLTIVEQRTGRTPVIYTGPAWWKSNVAPLVALARFLLWLARYPNRFVDGHQPTPGDWPSAPGPFTRLAVWQYSDTNGTLDRNVCDETTFAELTRNTPPNPTPEEDVLNMAEITETQLREIIREETNDIRGGVMVAVAEGRKHHGSARGWLVALGKALVRLKGSPSIEDLRADAIRNDPTHDG